MTGSAGAGAWAPKTSDGERTTSAGTGCGRDKTGSLDASDAGTKLLMKTGSLKPRSGASCATPGVDARYTLNSG